MKYSGTAVMKNIGGYDTGTGYTAQSWLSGDSNRNKHTALTEVKDNIDEAAGWLPEKLDEMTWNHIWQAVKLETKKANPNLTGESMLKKAGARFDYVIEKTQVYDSNGLVVEEILFTDYIDRAKRLGRSTDYYFGRILW